MQTGRSILFYEEKPDDAHTECKVLCADQLHKQQEETQKPVATPLSPEFAASVSTHVCTIKHFVATVQHGERAR